VKYNCRGESMGRRVLVRYADDFVILCESKEDAIKAQEQAEQFLLKRGLSLSTEKTKIVHLSEGFDFLGFNVRHYETPVTQTGWKLLIKPNKGLIKSTKSKIRTAFLKHKGNHVGLLINEINPIITGIAQYCRKAIASRIFSYLDDYLYTRQRRYADFIHHNKSNKWKKNKYWGRLNLSREDKWVFGDKSKGTYMLKFSWFNIERHVMVIKSHSPDNPELKDYWKKRYKTKAMDEAQKFNKKKEMVAKKQDYTCTVCGESLFNDEPIDLHHKIPRSKGGKDEIKNLTWVHQYCHNKIHYS
jgi:RNA-directed DNA polymerase